MANASGDLFKIRVVEENEDKVKVHYIGYSKKYDEWKDKQELVVLDDGDDPGDSSCSNVSGEQSTPFSLYRELGNKIKLSLQSGRKISPSIKIEMPFDEIMFEGGLGRFGRRIGQKYGCMRYGIAEYKDLDSLLGKGWHWRGLNEVGDFCFVILDSVEFYLHKRRPLKEFFPAEDGVASSSSRNLGQYLVFKFIRGDGIPSQFGVDKDIFV